MNIWKKVGFRNKCSGLVWIEKQNLNINVHTHDAVLAKATETTEKKGNKNKFEYITMKSMKWCDKCNILLFTYIIILMLEISFFLFFLKHTAREKKREIMKN